MSFSIEDVFVEVNKIRFAEEKVEVLQSFGRPEGLHGVEKSGVLARDVGERSVGDGSATMSFDGGEHVPAFVLEGGVSSDAVEDEDGFDCFGSGLLVSSLLKRVVKSKGIVKRV